MSKRLIKNIQSLYQKIPIKLIKKIYNSPTGINDAMSQIMCDMCKTMEKETDHFVSFIRRPKQTNLMPTILENGKYSKCAIVVQGPIHHTDAFTKETLKLYRRRYPNDYIIFSTWNDEDAIVLKEIEEIGVYVVRCEKPNYSGRGNVNFQLKSTFEGVNKAKELGAQYICKTRSDQRLLHSNLMEYLVNLIETFPTGDAKIQKGRIIALGMEYGNMFYPFFMSDFFYFGTSEDISLMFDGVLDERRNVEAVYNHTRRECAESNLVTEIQILQNYANKIGFVNDFSVRAYWEFIRQHMICLSRTEIGLYWPKYDVRYSEHQRNGIFHENDDSEKLKTYNWDFVHWLNLYNGSLVYMEEYEKLADYRL